MTVTGWEDVDGFNAAHRSDARRVRAAITAHAPAIATTGDLGAIGAPTLEHLLDAYRGRRQPGGDAPVARVDDDSEIVRPVIEGGFKLIGDLSRVVFDMERELDAESFLRVAFGLDKASTLLREAMLGVPSAIPKRPHPFGPSPRPIPDLQLDPRMLGLAELLDALAEFSRGAGQSNVRAYNEWASRATVDARGITAVDPFIVCGGDEVVIRGAFPAAQPAFTTVRLPNGSGCTDAVVVSWRSKKIRVVAPKDVAPGAVGFLSTDGPAPQVDLAAAMEGARRVAGVLGDFELLGTFAGAAAALTWQRVAQQVPLRSLPCPGLLPKQPGAAHAPNEIHGGPPRIRAFQIGGAPGGFVHPGATADLIWDVAGSTKTTITAFDLPRAPGDPSHELPALAGTQQAAGTRPLGPLTMSTPYDWRGGYRLEAENKCGQDTATALLEMREDPPLFGMADVHVHFLSHLGFGGYGIWGKPHPVDPSTSGEAALRECLPPCSYAYGPRSHGAGGELPTLDAGPHLVGGAWGAEMSFDGWPRHDSVAHQQCFIDWVKRAHDGGLRLVVCLANNSEKFAEGMAGLRPPAGHSLPWKDMEAVQAQVDAMVGMRDFVAAQTLAGQEAWLEIVTTPDEAREAIRKGQLAMVIGVEVASLGGWHTPDELEEAATAAGLTVPQLVDGLVDALYKKGVRHVFPVHGLNNAFGGTAFFQVRYDAGNSEATGSRFDPDPAPASLGIAWRLDSAYDHLPVEQKAALWAGITAGVNWSDPTIRGVPNDNGHINSQGATPHMPCLLRALMRRGMMIDIGHMGHKTTLDVLAEVERDWNRYPVVSGHAAFRELNPGYDAARAGQRWTKSTGNSLTPTDVAFGTRNPGELSSELDMSPEVLARIRALGGLIAPILTQRHPHGCTCDRSVANTNEGSSRSFAQALLYIKYHLRGRRVAFGSDINGAAPLPSARFGPNGSWYLTKEEDRFVANANGTTRRDQVHAQDRGVQYDTPLRDYREARFPDPFPGQPVGMHEYPFDADERNCWEALAAAESGIAPSQMDHPLLRSPGTKAFIENLAHGIRSADRQSIPEPTNAVQVAGFLLAHPNEQQSPSPAGTAGWVTELQPIFAHWAAMRGDRMIQSRPQALWNRALPGVYVGDRLTRCSAGRRDYDINIDGMAHYGLLPDLIQDLHNVGADVNVLFRSAEDYIRTWEQCVARSPKIPIP